MNPAIDFTPTALDQLERFGPIEAFMLRDELRSLLDSPGRLANGKRLDAPGEFLIELAPGYDAHLHVSEGGLTVMGVYAQEELE